MCRGAELVRPSSGRGVGGATRAQQDCAPTRLNGENGRHGFTDGWLDSCAADERSTKQPRGNSPLPDRCSREGIHRWRRRGVAESPAFQHSVLQRFSSPRSRGQALHQNVHRRVVIEREPGAVDEAQAGNTAGDLRDERGFTEAHLPHALAKTVVTGQLTHPAGRAGRQLAQRREFLEWRGGHSRATNKRY